MLSAIALALIAFFLGIGAYSSAKETRRLLRSQQDLIAALTQRLQSLEKAAPNVDRDQGEAQEGLREEAVPPPMPAADPPKPEAETVPFHLRPKPWMQSQSLPDLTPHSISVSKGVDQDSIAAAATIKREAEQSTPDKSPSPSLEAANLSDWFKKIKIDELIGARLFVWIGGIALLFAGAYFVRYSIESGLLSPSARVVIGTVTAFAFLAAGEWLRHKSSRVAQGLTAAGIGNLFGIILAAVKLYDMVPEAIGFVLLALTAAMAIVLSLRQGPIAAVLGMVGGFATPALVGSDNSHPAFLFGYLLLLEIGLLFLARARNWVRLVLGTLLGINLWALIWLTLMFDADHSLWFVLFLMGSAGIVLALYSSMDAGDSRKVLGIPVLFVLPVQVVAIVFMMTAVVVKAGFTRFEWFELAVVGIAAMVIAKFRQRYMALAWCGLLLPLLLVFVWTYTGGAAASKDAVLIFSALAVAFAGLALVFSVREGDGWQWIGLSIVAAVGYYIAAIEGLSHLTDTIFGIVALAIAVIYAGYFYSVCGRSLAAIDHHYRQALVVGTVIFFVTIAIGYLVPDGYKALALALEIAALGWIEAKAQKSAPFGIGPLRNGVLRLAAVLLLPAMIISSLVGLEAVSGYWLPVVLFGLPGAGLLLAAEGFRKRAQGAADNLLGHFGVIGLTISVLLEAGLLSDKPMFATVPFHVMGPYWAIIFFATSAVWDLANRRWERLAFANGAKASAFLGLIAVWFGIANNTELFEGSYNDSNLNVWAVLILAYVVPMVVIGMLAQRMRGQFPTLLLRGLWGSAALLLVIFLTVVVMTAFHSDSQLSFADTVLDRHMGYAEIGIYTLLWLALGGAYLWLDRHYALRPLAVLGVGLLGLALTWLVAVPLVHSNPLFIKQFVGATPIINWLLWIYAVPGAIAAIISYRAAQVGLVKQRPYLQAGAIILFFVTVSLQVKQAFHGAILAGTITGEIEQYCYSAVWLVFGAIVMVYGAVKDQSVARYGGLLVLGLTVGKVFLYDTSELTGLYRVASFLGLGLSLMGLAYLFQKIVVKRSVSS